MKKKIVITLLVGCMLLVTALPHVNACTRTLVFLSLSSAEISLPHVNAYTRTINNNASNQQILEKELENIVDKQMSTYNWKLNDLSYTKTFEEVNSGKIEMRWDVNIKHTLNYSTPEMVPVLKGKIKAYNEVKNNLGQSKKNVLEKDINNWKDNLQQYINEPQDANESIKVIGELDNKNKIIPSSLSFYIQNEDEYIPMSEVLKAKTDIDIEQNSYNNFKDESLGITTNNLIAY